MRQFKWLKMLSLICSGAPPSPAPQTTVPQNDRPPPAHQFHRTIGHSTSTPIVANDHSHRSSVHTDSLPSTTHRAAAIAVLCLRSQPPLTRAPAAAAATTPPSTVLSPTAAATGDRSQENTKRAAGKIINLDTSAHQLTSTSAVTSTSAALPHIICLVSIPCHVSCHVILHCHIIRSEFLPIENHHSSMFLHLLISI